MWGIYQRTIPRPVISTWGIWAILGGLLLVAYHDVGATMETTLPAAWMGFINPLLIFILALKYGELRWSRLETFCVIIFIITVIAWKSSELAIVGLIGGIFADTMGLLPQIRHSWKYPQDEPWLPWTLFGVGSAVNLLGIEKWEFAHYSFPVYMTIGSALVALPLILHRLKQP